ncbi:hypothetical protein [Thermococcus sp.]
MTLFLLAFTASFYTGKVKKNVLSAFLGILLFVALIGKLGYKIMVEGMTEENLLLTASFIFGATGSFLYQREEFMEKLEALFLILIAALIVVIFLLSL